MITLSINLTEEQAEEMVDSIQKSLDADEAWEPRLTFQPEDAERIQTNLEFQVNITDAHYDDL